MRLPGRLPRRLCCWLSPLPRCPCWQAVGDELAGVLGALSLEPGTHGPLLGLPTPAGTHIRFDDDGEVAAVSPRQKTFLRGLPEPRGTHIHFD